MGSSALHRYHVDHAQGKRSQRRLVFWLEIDGPNAQLSPRSYAVPPRSCFQHLIDVRQLFQVDGDGPHWRQKANHDKIVLIHISFGLRTARFDMLKVQCAVR